MLKSFPFKSGKSQGYPILLLSFNVVLKVLANVTENEVISINIKKQIIFLADNWENSRINMKICQSS